ncbi:POK19 protein, partial [Columbina picui]|nr:POK19 protein [Columbina picui]
TNQNWIVIPKRSSQPLSNAVTVFTDAGKRSRKAAATWKDEQGWHHQILPAHSKDSLQTLELLAVVWALSNWMHQPLNVMTDSLYVAGVTNRIEDAAIRDIKNQRLAELFM